MFKALHAEGNKSITKGKFSRDTHRSGSKQASTETHVLRPGALLEEDVDKQIPSYLDWRQKFELVATLQTWKRKLQSIVDGTTGSLNNP